MAPQQLHRALLPLVVELHIELVSGLVMPVVVTIELALHSGTLLIICIKSLGNAIDRLLHMANVTFQLVPEPVNAFIEASAELTSELRKLLVEDNPHLVFSHSILHYALHSKSRQDAHSYKHLLI
jgi:hypothetical protein